MKKEQVKLGGTYFAKVSGKVVPVRLDAESPHGGWQAFNLETHKTVRIKSAQRLRGPAADDSANQRTKAVAAAQAADAVANAHAVKSDAKRTKTTTVDAGGGIMVDVVESKTAGAKKAPKEPETKKSSGLDAAAQVLKAKGQPMNCKDIVETMLAKGMWKTNGKTPAATIYSAMLREIDGRPGESRFVKSGRGLFALATSKKD